MPITRNVLFYENLTEYQYKMYILAKCVEKACENRFLTTRTETKYFNFLKNKQKESKLKWLQFQFLHRIIPKNDYPYNI